jgi:WD40 repeat protein/serine/threonine protein kinase
MSDNDASAADPFGQIADEFVEAIRQGKRPSVEEFAHRYPQHADAIREMLPALVLMEQAKTAGEEGKAAVPPAVPTLRQLGDYRILREVGRGGMGVVYEAQQLSLGRHVAIKVLPSHALLDPRQLVRFQREARSAAKLHHTNIVPVFGVGEQDGLHYYVMQFIAGLGLDVVVDELRRLRQSGGKHPPTQADAPGRPTNSSRNASAVAVARGLLSGVFRQPEPASDLTTAPAEPVANEELAASSSVGAADTSAAIHLPGQSGGSTLSESGSQYWQSVARIGMQVADALTHAASQGVLHRDIKPSNLLLDDTGNVWVTDFGLAKAASDGDDLTHLGDVIGTLRYLAPERFNGQGDLRSDIYSLGLTLYEMLVLRPAFDEADRNKLVKQVMHDEPLRPRKVNPGVPRDLETVVLKAITRDPAHRYQTPAELADDLKRFVEDRPVKARRVSEAEKLWRWCRRNPLPASLLAGMVLVFLAGFAGVSWQWRVAEAAREKETGQRSRAEALRQEAETARDQAGYNLYVATLNLAQRDWESGNGAHVRELLDACLPRQPGDRDPRGWEWHYQDRLCRSALRVFAGNGEEMRCVAFHPDGSLIATGGEEGGTVRLWDTASGAPRRVLRREKGDRIMGLAFSPDGSRLASCGDDKDVLIWDTAGGVEVRRLVGHAGRVEAVAFSPDGARVASASGDGTVRLWDAVGGRELHKFTGHQGGVNGVAFAPDGKRLASVGTDGTLRLWDPAGGAPRVLLGEAGSARCLAFSPDGERLAAAGEGGERAVRVWDVATGRVVRVLRGHLHRILGLAYGPDGTWLASASEDGTVRVWDVLAGRELRALKGHTGIVRGLACSRDGTRLASAGHDGTARLWDAATDPGPRALTGHRGDVFCVAFSPDGARLASGGGDGTVRLWDLAGGVPRVFTGHTGSVQSVAFSPDGAWLASGGTDGVLRLWDLARGGPARAIAGHPRTIWALAFSPDGALLASGCSDGQVRLWDPASGHLRHAFAAHSDRVHCVAFSRDGSRLASCSEDHSVRVWDLAGRPLRDFKGHDERVHCVAFRADGAQLATASRDGTLRLWDLAGDQAPRVLRGHTGWVSWLAYSPDGARLATAGDDTTVRLWDSASGAELRVLREHGRWVRCVAFSPDGGQLAAAGQDGTIRLWDARPWSPERHVEQEARGLVEGLLARPLLRAEVLAQLQAHKGISEEVRRQALELAGRYQDDAGRFNRASRDVVRYRDAPPALCRKALARAQAACDLAPESGTCLTTLGVAQYRLGQYAEARATLSRAEALNRADPHERPADLAFLAMAHRRLGDNAGARAALDALREVMSKWPASTDEEALAFLNEAEVLLAP